MQNALEILIKVIFKLDLVWSHEWWTITSVSTDRIRKQFQKKKVLKASMSSGTHVLKVRQRYKDCLLLIKVEHRAFESIGRESPRCCSQRSDTRSHTSSHIQGKLLSVSLDPAQGKSSIVWKGCCGFGEKSTRCPHFESPGSKQTPPAGYKLRRYVVCLVRLLAWWMNTFLKEQLLRGSKQTQVWGERERFWEQNQSPVEFRKHEHESALSRYVFCQITPLPPTPKINK